MEEIAGIKGIATFNVAGIPVGGVGVGLLASGLMDGVMGWLEGITGKKLPVWAAKGLGAYAASRWLHKLVGPEGAKFATAILAVDAVQSLYDFRALTSGLFKKVEVKVEVDEISSSVGTYGMGPIEHYREEAPELELVRGLAEVGKVEEEEVLVSFT